MTFESSEPGKLAHVDGKKLGRTPDSGVGASKVDGRSRAIEPAWRGTGRSVAVRIAVAVMRFSLDAARGCPRLTCAEILDNETRVTASVL